MDLQQLRKQKETLTSEIIQLKEHSLQATSEEEEKSWESAIESKEIHLNNITTEIVRLQGELKQQFLNDIFHKRSHNTQENEKLKIAKEDAEQTAFNIIILSPEEIANFFSTRYHKIEYEKGTRVFPKKFSYVWFYPVNQRKLNVIPLSPGIEIPQRKVNSGEYKDILFTMEKFFKDRKFVTKCKEYYKQFNINLDISRDKNYKKKKYWIHLNLNNNGFIQF